MTAKRICETTVSVTAEIGVLEASHCRQVPKGKSCGSISDDACGETANAVSPPTYRFVPCFLERRRPTSWRSSRNSGVLSSKLVIPIVG